MINARLLIISDDLEAGQMWAYALRRRGLEVFLVASAEEALEQWEREIFDLLIIDLYTSHLDGLELCQRLRAEAINPILLFTPRCDEAYSLKAYQLGVDECIAKPISPPLFLAKVTAWLRRSWTIPTQGLPCLQVGDLQLDPVRRQAVTATGSVVKLTNLEFRLFHLLMSHHGQVLETNFILDQVWGYAGRGDGPLLKNVVYRLRRKIECDPRQPHYILTVAGTGYTLQPD